MNVKLKKNNLLFTASWQSCITEEDNWQAQSEYCVFKAVRTLLRQTSPHAALPQATASYYWTDED